MSGTTGTTFQIRRSRPTQTKRSDRCRQANCGSLLRRWTNSWFKNYKFFSVVPTVQAPHDWLISHFHKNKGVNPPLSLVTDDWPSGTSNQMVIFLFPCLVSKIKKRKLNRNDSVWFALQNPNGLHRWRDILSQETSCPERHLVPRIFTSQSLVSATTDVSYAFFIDFSVFHDLSLQFHKTFSGKNSSLCQLHLWQSVSS